MSARVVLKMHQTIDGFVCTPEGDEAWVRAHLDESVLEWEVEHLWQAEVHIMGRVVYEDMARYWPASTEPPARPMNEIPKVVFSKTLEEAPWGPARIVDGELASEIARLKSTYSSDILAHGGAAFAQSLAKHDLIDEYRLLVHPVALGEGKPCISTALDLRLASCQEFPSGVVALVYSRA